MARKRQGKTKLQYLVWLYTWDPFVGVRSGRLSTSIDHGASRYAKEDAEITMQLYRKMKRGKR